MKCTKCDCDDMQDFQSGHFYYCPECKSEYWYKKGTWKFEV